MHAHQARLSQKEIEREIGDWLARRAPQKKWKPGVTCDRRLQQLTGRDAAISSNIYQLSIDCCKKATLLERLHRTAGKLAVRKDHNFVIAQPGISTESLHPVQCQGDELSGAGHVTAKLRVDMIAAMHT